MHNHIHIHIYINRPRKFCLSELTCREALFRHFRSACPRRRRSGLSWRSVAPIRAAEAPIFRQVPITSALAVCVWCLVAAARAARPAVAMPQHSKASRN